MPRPDGARAGLAIRKADLRQYVPPPRHMECFREANGGNITMLKVLVIDESDHVCRTVKRSLERRQDCRVFVSRGTEDGLTMARNLQPAFVLLDIDMSDLDGVGFLSQLHEDPETCHIPVIAMSTDDDMEKRLRPGRAPVEHCLVKPFELGRLHTVVGQTISGRGVRGDSLQLDSRPALVAA
jgi:two-component system cell cycle response regulator DivK